MRTTRATWVWAAVLCASAGSATACNLVLGLDPYQFPGSGGGGAGSSSSSSGTATGGMDGGEPDGNDGGDGGDSRAIWAMQATDIGATTGLVAAMAVGPDGHVFLTGAGNPLADFNCASSMIAPDSGTDPQGGYLVELDGTTGACVWAFLFAGQGTGVAVNVTTDAALADTVALTGTFTGSLTIAPGSTLTASATDSFVAVFNPPVSGQRSVKWVAQIWENNQMAGNQTTTAVALYDTTLAVSGYFTGSLGLSYPGGTRSLANNPDGEDAFALSFNTMTGQYSDALLITSKSSGANQLANSVAVDGMGDLATAGTTSDTTYFNGGSGVSGPGNPTLFASTLSSGNAVNLETILAGTATQSGGCIAFNGAQDVLMGGQFYGTAGVVGVNPDGGTSYTAMGGPSVLVARYSSVTGEPLSSLQLGSSSTAVDASIAGLAPSSNGTVAFAGGFSGAAQLTAGTSTATLTSVGQSQNVYVAKVDDMLGTVLWVERYGDGSANQVADAVGVDPTDGSILVAGHFKGNVEFGAPTAKLGNGTGADQIFVAKLSP
jgi:hypothetical protein